MLPKRCLWWWLETEIAISCCCCVSLGVWTVSVRKKQLKRLTNQLHLCQHSHTTTGGWSTMNLNKWPHSFPHLLCKQGKWSDPFRIAGHSFSGPIGLCWLSQSQSTMQIGSMGLLNLLLQSLSFSLHSWGPLVKSKDYSCLKQPHQQVHCFRKQNSVGSCQYVFLGDNVKLVRNKGTSYTNNIIWKGSTSTEC